MNKSDLIAQVAAKSGLTKAGAETAIDATFNAITGELNQGGTVRVVNFGTFVVGRRPATQGRNPRTGEPIKISARTVAKFRPGKHLRDSINNA